MIINAEKSLAQTQGVGQVSRAKVNANARMFNFFSNMVYSNPYIAIIRELTANGIDAMRDAGRGDEQMVITLPTDFTPYMVFRDYGTGMSHDFMMDGFMTYTESTKTDSNEAIGGFGIGSKAPLSYTDQFTIKSFIDGTVNVYSVFKDEDDCPAIAHLGNDTTTEPNGVEIMFPVEGSDVSSFRDAAYKILTYFNPLPELKNAAEPIQLPEYVVRTNNWGFKKGAVDSRLIMGGIAYPITKGQVKEIDDFLDYGIDFYVPIGACSIALSREALMYDDRTIRVLKSLVDTIRPDIEKYVAQMFDQCNNRWDAEALFTELSSRTGNPHRQRMVRTNATYKGTKLTGRLRPIDKFAMKVQIAQVTTNRYSKTNYGYWTEGTQNPTMRSWLNDLIPADIGHVLIDDAPNRPILRMRNYLQNNDIVQKGALIIRTLNGIEFSKMDWLRLIVKLGRPKVVWLSEVDPATVVRAPSQPRVKRVKAFITERSLNAPRSAKDKSVDVLPTKGYYLTMNNFNVDEGQITSRELAASGIKPGELFYFNKQDFIDAGIADDPNWKPAKVAFDQQMSTYKATHRNMGLASAFNAILRERSSHTSDVKMGYLIDIVKQVGVKIPSRGPLYQLSKLYNMIKDELNHQDMSMREILEVDYKKERELIKKLLISAADTYPELWLLISMNRYSQDAYVPIYNKLIG